MKPAIHDGLVLYAPMDHPERLAAGMADVSDCELCYPPTKRKGITLGDVLGVLVIFGLAFGVWVAT